MNPNPPGGPIVHKCQFFGNYVSFLFSPFSHLPVPFCSCFTPFLPLSSTVTFQTGDPTIRVALLKQTHGYPCSHVPSCALRSKHAPLFVHFWQPLVAVRLAIVAVDLSVSDSPWCPLLRFCLQDWDSFFGNISFLPCHYFLSLFLAPMASSTGARFESLIFTNYVNVPHSINKLYDWHLASDIKL